ncbi:MAG TPA: biopolymer transporter ExbD [Candidatus Krumholzibacteria bacterium]|nr:biopolymer transporter ExbD [Candidatus Krumholzibacteria bacterium]
MKRFQSETQQTIAKVNVTPIIDVALVLVIILMITAPMIAVSNVDVKLPEAHTHNLEGHDRVNVTLGAKGELAVDDTDINLPALRTTIASHLEGHKNAIVVIRADKSVAYSAVRQIVEAARAAGAARIAVGTTQRGNVPQGASL